MKQIGLGQAYHPPSTISVEEKKYAETINEGLGITEIRAQRPDADGTTCACAGAA
jgi:hypothetical protein